MILRNQRVGCCIRAWVCGALLALIGLSASARVVSDPADRLGFFTVMADKMLRSTFPFGITNIPVCSNGVFVYTPAVQRLLQLSANLCDASNTNFFPSVFRPLFANDATSNLFIIGYVQVTNVTDASDPQLAWPYAPAQLAGAKGTPISSANGPINVYGVPWIIGAKKGLPGFNQLSLVTLAPVTRKLEVNRTSSNWPSIYHTNQMYIMAITNNLGISFWNSYTSNYPRPLTIHVSDELDTALTNSVSIWASRTNFLLNFTVNSWPGSQWNGAFPNAVPSTNSFVTTNYAFCSLAPSVYRFVSSTFDPVGSPTSFSFESTTPALPPLPQFGLGITNYLQAYILDGSNVIDYVQLQAPANNGNLTQILADPNYPQAPSNIYYQWSTNTPTSNGSASWGVLNQMYISEHPNIPSGEIPVGGQWAGTTTPMGITAQAEAAYFEGFFYPFIVYNGQTYVNSQLSMMAPYIPTRTLYSATLLQANDPLIHYLVSDLTLQAGAPVVWQSKLLRYNGTWSRSDDSTMSPLPQPPQTPIGDRYQAWLCSGQMKTLAYTVVAANTYACRDPLVYSPDYWNFPSNLVADLTGLGQVHRGTPWQTIYLKDADLTKTYSSTTSGTNSWMAWSGDLDVNDAMLMAPVNDWHLAGLILSLLNSNDPTQLLSVNDSNPADWQAAMDGTVAYSNSLPVVTSSSPLQFDTYIVSSNSPQAFAMANAILQLRTNSAKPWFYSVGDILSASALSGQSPFLNPGSSAYGQQQSNYAIPDAVYEAIPAQLLLKLRPDSIGSIAYTNNGWNLMFSGADNYSYAVQTSTDLMNWLTLSTNQPVQGWFSVPITGPVIGNQYFRTQLLPFGN